MWQTSPTQVTIQPFLQLGLAGYAWYITGGTDKNPNTFLRKTSGDSGPNPSSYQLSPINLDLTKVPLPP